MLITRCLLIELLLLLPLISKTYSTDDFVFLIQPQIVRINDRTGNYVTRDDHYIGRVLYRSDQLQLACECQTQYQFVDYHIYWTVNHHVFHQFNNSNSIELLINNQSVQAPVSYVTCHCLFTKENLIKRDYRYKLYIDLESDPSLKPINYSIRTSVLEQHVYEFVQHHVLVILSCMLIITGITCPLMILKFSPTIIE